jgi:hypothetical protein
MKASHFRTPRNLAECDFTVGYPTAGERLRSIRGLIGHLASIATICALGLMIGYALAMMVPA